MRNLDIEIIEPLSSAFNRTKRILFPFDLGKWFAIGFSAFLAYLGQRGGSNFNFNQYSHSSGNSDVSFHSDQFNEFYFSVKPYLPAMIIGFLFIVLAFKILFLWLNCRGHFMFVHNIAGNNAEVSKPWKIYSNHGNSVFLFLLCVMIIPWLLIAGAAIFGGLYAINNFTTPAEIFSSPNGKIFITTGIIAATGTIVLAIPLTIVKVLTREFIIPIMMIKNFRCIDGWRYFNHVTEGYKGSVVLYLLFKIVINICIAIIVTMLACITCCIFACLSGIPYIGAVVTLPFFVLIKSYSLDFLAQFGEGADIFAFYKPAVESSQDKETSAESAPSQTEEIPEQLPESSESTIEDSDQQPEEAGEEPEPETEESDSDESEKPEQQ